MKECDQKKNLARCNCTYEPCSRKGICCECIKYHLRSGELPACCFPDDVEVTFDRSFRRFAELVQSGRRWW
ncbi:MAG: cytosolic protein [Deltaproteobacteria bacterium]|nr:cytosolic protein [Deltaproteobacteria bacterium]